MASRQIRLFSWNVNGVRAVAKKGFLEWLHASDADIVALQETKANPDQLSAAVLRPAGYTSEWCAAERAGYSGVATFSREAPLAVTRGLGDPLFDREGRVLISQYPDFTLYNVYFPSGSSGGERVAFKLAFYQRFLDLITPRIAAGEALIVVGDVNTAYAPIDLARPRENQKTSGFLPEERAALGQFFEGGLIDSFRYLRPAEVKYSWWSQVTNARERNIGWRLDYVLVSPVLQDRLVAADIHPEIGGSDHCPVSVVLDLG
jgi:exodeoxyribonuclease-3